MPTRQVRRRSPRSPRLPLPRVVLVLTTVPHRKIARQIAAAALEKKVAACATLLSAFESHYVWKGEREISREIGILFKTTPEAVPALFTLIRALHPYEVPEILSWPADQVWPDYARWVGEQVVSDDGSSD